ncbi:YciI family protein [Pseudonocardia adelaidensis]|uniref:YciI family protein n=1 Tax=Pseudonocardia adelaidensis TaxID=648754 RepID=A0ABP9N720_9PSEU
MKYVLMFAETPQYAEDLAAMGDAERQAAYDDVGRWFADNAARITHHVRLQPAHTATTMRKLDGRADVVDGPFVEGKEIVIGFVEVEVADLDEALAMARSWPACPVIELRPVAP